MAATPSNTLLALFAHPGDAEILSAGTLLRLADLGWKIHLATMTAGECGSATLPAAEIIRMRGEESRKAAAAIGATCHCLEEAEGYVVHDKPTVRKVVDFLRGLAPDVVLTHALRDSVVDHEQTALLARAACQIFTAPNCSAAPLAAGARVPHLYFSDPILGREPGGGFVTPTTVVRITRQQTKKLEMVSCHASVLDWMSRQAGVPNLVETIREHGIDRGRLAGAVSAEAFVQYIGHGFPADDLLRELLAR